MCQTALVLSCLLCLIVLYLQLEKENSASLQIIFRYETMLKEFQIKEEKIHNLNKEIEAANEMITDFTEQIKDFREKLEA
ncbi:hypothetical protein NQ317_017116 [Molorchus minor]|uniref:Uncharacterized protein n=1 Tax=Molorchus minor TaxID=1323400 RepID=A0ABQ9JIP9_9CUCU|nr:hypothetical protein NQ317_017116 [Molorchus minor]